MKDLVDNIKMFGFMLGLSIIFFILLGCSKLHLLWIRIYYGKNSWNYKTAKYKYYYQLNMM